MSQAQIDGAKKRCEKYTNRTQFITASFDTVNIQDIPPVDFVVANFSLHLAPCLERALKRISTPLKQNVRKFFCYCNILFRIELMCIYY